MPCPLVFSTQEKALQNEHEVQWNKGFELMGAVIEQLGVYQGWDGWVDDAYYDLMKARLENCLERFLDREAKNDIQRTEWIKAWPFAEQPTQNMCRYTPPPRHLYR